MAFRLQTFSRWPVRIWRLVRRSEDASRASDGLADSCLRGIRVKDWICEGQVLLAAFVADPKTASTRTDGKIETSINWEDDPGLAGRMAREPSSQHGVARLARTDLEYVARRAPKLGCLDMERRAEKENPHHGNILYEAELPKPLQRMLADALALHANLVTDSPIELGLPTLPRGP